ncbi:MAG: diguanylate cyclase [Capsulimonadaceae bacterium]|nr:diguanylate cyclase [Capsulimonadaceae bacterium]
MAHTSPPQILALRKPGWVEVGNSRVFLMDALGGFFSYREQLAQEVGIEAESEICQRAGYASAERLVASFLQSGAVEANEAGFRQGVAMFGMGGYGNFDVDEMQFDESWAKISATDSIEGWMFHQQGTRHGNSCDYARGFFTGLMASMRQAVGDDSVGLNAEDAEDADPITCIETSCVAAGDEVCTFVIGLTSELVTKGFQPTTVVQSSIRETLLRLNRQLEHILDHSRKDHLTNLYNRSFFEAALRQRIGFAKRRSDVVSLAIIDVDHFKQVNDTQGHAVGDRVLRQLAYILENQARENDIVARLGGDEFVWLMPATPPESAASVARRISGFLESMRDEIGFPMTVSVGVAGYPRDAASPTELKEAADNALYVAKEEGRNQVVVCGTDPGSRTPHKPVPPVTRETGTPPTRPAASIVTAHSTLPAQPPAHSDGHSGRRVKSRLRSTRSGRGR